MSRVHFHRPPELDEEYRAGLPVGTPCLICLMVARGAQLEFQRPAWEPFTSDGKDAQKWFPYDTGETVDIREADLVGISDMMPGILVPVCWDHLAGIVIRQAPEPRPLLQAGGPLPPAFNGKGRAR